MTRRDLDDRRIVGLSDANDRGGAVEPHERGSPLGAGAETAAERVADVDAAGGHASRRRLAETGSTRKRQAAAAATAAIDPA